MKNLDEIKMLAFTLPKHEVIMALPDEDPDTGSGDGDEDP